MAPAIAILSSLFALAPPDAPIDVSDVQVARSESSTHVTSYDADGEVSSEVFVWIDDGQPRIDAVWPDGLYLSVAGDGLVESDDLAEAVERLVALETALAGVTEEESNDCLFAMVGLAGAVGSRNPLLIAGGLYAVHKWCVKTLQDGDDVEDDESGTEDGE